jgi:hypothetical protein
MATPTGAEKTSTPPSTTAGSSHPEGPGRQRPATCRSGSSFGRAVAGREWPGERGPDDWACGALAAHRVPRARLRPVVDRRLAARGSNASAHRNGGCVPPLRGMAVAPAGKSAPAPSDAPARHELGCSLRRLGGTGTSCRRARGRAVDVARTRPVRGPLDRASGTSPAPPTTASAARPPATARPGDHAAATWASAA